MKILTQSVQYEIEPRRYYNPYGQERVQQSPVEVAFTALVLFFSVIVWLWILAKLTSKAGYTGIARWVWFAFLAFPLTSGISLVTFCLVSWPIQKQLKAQAVKPKGDDIDGELNRLKRGL